MALENKLGLDSSADLAREEERISKKKAAHLTNVCPDVLLPLCIYISFKIFLTTLSCIPSAFSFSTR